MADESSTDTILRSARHLAAESSAATGSDHLLTALVLHSEPVKELLDAFDVTPTVAAHVFRQGVPTRHTAPDVPFDSSATDLALLAALIHDDRSHAASLLAECGVDAAEVRAAIVSGHLPRRPDPIKPALRECRDRLLGRRAFPGFRFRAFGIIPIKFNYAPAPLMWARWEADLIAKGQWRRTRTDDVLVTMLGTFEVAAAYPHLIGPDPEVYAGTRRLLSAGLDHDQASALSAAADLGTDAIRPSRLLSNPNREPRHTTHLLDMLHRNADTRSARLLSLALPAGW